MISLLGKMGISLLRYYHHWRNIVNISYVDGLRWVAEARLGLINSLIAFDKRSRPDERVFSGKQTSRREMEKGDPHP
jgi:hypothetical protein